MAVHVLVVLTAILIDNIGHLFDFISAFGVALLMFIFPALFYLSTVAKFAKKSER